jgi:hypothetical protein
MGKTARRSAGTRETMRAFKSSVLGVIVAAAVAVPWWVHHRAAAAVHAQNDWLRRQADLLAQTLAANQQLSNEIARARSLQPLSDAELTELLKLRNEVGQLKWTLKGINQYQRELAWARKGLENLAQEKERGGGVATTLFADGMEQELRRGRVAQLKQWLQEAPAGEVIPELKFVPEEQWLRTADWPRATYEEYENWMSTLRGDGEMTFATMAFNAVKEYARANNNQFPTDLSRLKPYFATPIEDSILRRYHIVPASSLNERVAGGLGSDWVITQKAPVNRRDRRVAIGLEHMRGVGGRIPRWDPP